MQNFKRLTSYALTIGIIAASAWALLHRQDLIDWYRLRDYTPPQEISALAENTTMTDYGQKLFYVHDPQLENQETFNQTCTHFEETIVLGCYITHQSIHIYNVTDERLQGIREVTAAHEMLHAAYDRLSSSEKSEIDAMLINFYESIKDENERLRDTVESYRERDSDVVGNELHSILGTEIRELPEEIEQYYERYFTDRKKVVEYAENYENVFIEQQERIKSLAEQIKQLELALQGRRAELEAEAQAISAESNRLTRLRENDQIEEYNAAVPGYNQRVNSYRSSASAFNADIQKLNALIEEHNALAIEQKQLNSAIDSRAGDL